jgi:alkylation response protein AidB-like acyl-CoA dehydrogenase
MNAHSYAYGKNHWQLDPDIRPILGQYWAGLGEHQGELDRFGELAGGQAYQVAYHVDHDAPPALVSHDLDGARIDRARLCPQHAALLKDIAWINRPPYQGGLWLHHFALGYLLADPGLYCSLIVTNQTAYAIHKYAPQHAAWLEALLSGEMWGATWMTETHAGSDLGATLTEARLENGEWRLYGDTKYFASNAGLADLALATARPQGAPPGPKGIALFLVPRLDEGGQLNFFVRRLKDKSATRAVPTGEVEFAGSQAYLVGQAELGIYYTLENLTVSRLANAIGAMGLARKAHLEALLRSQARSAFGKALHEHPLMRYDLTDLAVRTAGGLALVFHAIAAFDQSWQATPPYTAQYHYARFLSHLAKNRTAEHAAQATRLGMEIFGGMGFLEETNLPRLHREALVTAIWEGTSNIQALDMLEAMQKKGAHETFINDFLPLLREFNLPPARKAAQTLEATLNRLGGLGNLEAQWYAKDALDRLADAAIVGLLYRLAGSGGERYARLAELYALRFLENQPYPAWALADREVWMPVENL